MIGRVSATLLGAWLVLGGATPAHGFPAMLLARRAGVPDMASPRVAVVRDGSRTVLSFAAEIRGNAGGLAWLLAVPPGVEAKNFNSGDGGLFEALDRFTTPRLIVTPDPAPCKADPAGATTVYATPETATFGEGRYDVTILSDKDSASAVRRLKKDGYRLSSAQAARVKAAVKGGARIAIARINADTGAGGLAPLQIAYDDPSGVLPLGFGDGAPSERLYVLSARGKGELKGLRGAKFPAGEAVPAGIQTKMAKVYAAMVATQDKGEGKAPPEATARLEYAGDVGLCEPCAGDPPDVGTLRKLGVFWLQGDTAAPKTVQRAAPGERRKAAAASAAGRVFVTRFRLTRGKGLGAPQLEITDDRNEFQARLDAAEAFDDPSGLACDAATAYREKVRARETAALAKLGELTGRKLTVGPDAGDSPKSWVDDVWK